MRIKRSTLDLWKKRLIVFFSVSVVGSILYILFITPAFTITTFELVGVPDGYKDTITSNVKDITNTKILKVLPGNRIFSYRGVKLKQSVVSVLPNTSMVTITPRGFHTLRIKVVAYEPFLKLDDTHAITKDGVMYTELNDIHSLVTLSLATTSVRTETDNDGITVVMVEGLTKERLASISSLVSKINSIIFVVRRIDIDPLGDISLYDEHNKSRVVFAGTQDTDKVWSNLVSAVDTDPLKSKLSTNKDNLEYLDARFGNKVFYKFTNDTKTAIIQSHATTSQATTTIFH